MPCDLAAVAAEAGQFPSGKMPEAALIGRSNVGKSSLINVLVARKGLARAAKQPGRTQQIFFYELGGALMLVDLPGYGYAQAPRAAKESWNDLARDYLSKRGNLRALCLLLDGRHGALAADVAMMKFLDRAGVAYKAVLTKIDQVKPTERAARCEQTEALLAVHPAAQPGVIVTSAAKGIGIGEMREWLAARC
ncbi:MAG TPA: ribosome biogenesis GTP-binding protein YihA/YsxC [Alphaproteobacteria bacterium]|nr:ribosome biogenesis GTP-binding protein YihA/YsxC [Alphaproteobacteria bacterium]